MDVRWSIIFVYNTIILACFFRITATFKQQGVCYFPERWEGTWFQSGVRQPIIIEGSLLSTKGRCLASEGDKFLVVDDKRACYRCVVIHEKHANVLQYKETFCHGRDTLPTLCSLITGDALLFSMFRENAAPVPCPFRGPFTFTYNRGHGECRTPVSSIDSCTEDSKLLLSYQACPDVYGSESTVEELQCLAIWKEGSSRYLVGKVHHSHATSNEDRFRCFVYEKASPTTEALGGSSGGSGGVSGSGGSNVDYRVAQSGDATCNGLFSATEGSRTMILKKAPSLNKCRFPSWIANYNHWHTLDYSATYSFHHRNSTLRITNSSGVEMKVVCSQLKPKDETTVVLLTHFTMGCQSGFVCMSFYRRDIHVMEVQIGTHTKRQEDACSPAYFNRTNLPYVTLVTTTPETRACPYTGKFEVSNLIRSNDRKINNNNNNNHHQSSIDNRYYELTSIYNSEIQHMKRIKRVDQEIDCDNDGFSSLVIGCSSNDIMEFQAQCTSPNIITAYSCHGRWEENGTNYLITTQLIRPSHIARRFCFIYKESGPDLVLFSTAADSCNRIVRPGITGELVFNVTNIGKCFEASNSTRINLTGDLMKFIIFIHILNHVITIITTFSKR